VSPIKHIIFDLDHTLWDFNRNSKETLKVLFDRHNLERKTKAPFNTFLVTYYSVTNILWQKYDHKEITKNELRQLRLREVFSTLGFMDDLLASKIEKEYLSICPDKPHLINGTIELLDYIKTKKYPIYLLTNGFKDIQLRKIKASKIDHYFDQVCTSETSGYSKPDRRAFDYLLNKIKAEPNECLMIGDNLSTDIEGSSAIDMQNIYLNPTKIVHQGKPTFEVSSLNEIHQIIK